jgi:hypothetical protein
MIRKNKVRLGVDLLEGRDLPAVSALWFSGSMLVVQTDNAPTSVALSQSGSNYVVQDQGTGGSWSYPTAWVTQVEFQGGAGNDRFLNYVPTLPTRGFGFGGNDYLEGWNGADVYVGGDGDDILVGYGGNDAMWGGNGRDVIKGMTGDDSAYGEGGDDVVVGGDGNDYLSGGDGHDQITGGAGNDTQYGGNGDDTLVTIDAGTTDYADGQAGRDTVWSDMNWVWSGWFYLPQFDTASAEKMHTVTGFANGADRSLNGDSIADPTDGTNYKNFRNNPLFGVWGPLADDVDQESAADCWILAPLGAVANDNPSHIRSMVADFGDGTYGVALGNSVYRVDADLPTWNAASTDQVYAGLGHGGSLWVAIVEKAYTHHRTGANTYASIGWGDPADAMRQINATSVGQNYYAAGSNAATVANDVYNHWNAYQSCTICTGTVPPGSPLVGGHCYTVTAVNRDAWGNVTSIVVRNPWGGDNTGGNPYVTLTPAQLAACQIWVTWGNT